MVIANQLTALLLWSKLVRCARAASGGAVLSRCRGVFSKARTIEGGVVFVNGNGVCTTSDVVTPNLYVWVLGQVSSDSLFSNRRD